MDTIARLVAIEEIKQLKARYFRFMDVRDYDAMAEVFCRDAYFDATEGVSRDGPAGPTLQGRETIMAFIRQFIAEMTSVHHGHCHELTVDSETEAHGVIAMEDELRDLARKSVQLHGTGHYFERYRFEDGAWRIAETKFVRLTVDTH